MQERQISRVNVDQQLETLKSENKQLSKKTKQIDELLQQSKNLQKQLESEREDHEREQRAYLKMQEELKGELSRAKKASEEGASTPEDGSKTVSMVPFVEVMLKIKAQIKGLTQQNAAA